ncbi:MAG: TIGR02757 family protein [Deltaproteobacteria bacterium]|nr:TIGR02757 family protein [Deltaproteobacteria bacterium]
MDKDAYKLKVYLDRLNTRYGKAYLPSDPLEFVHGYRTPEDREVAGLIASSLAYGRVEGIRRSVGAVLGAMGKSPAAFAMRFDPARDRAAFAGFVHRFNRAADIRCLVWFARRMMEEAGSIGAFFTKGCPEGAEMKEALAAFSENVLGIGHGGAYPGRGLPKDAGVRFFFPSPKDGSACKRLNLYLRWMVRRGDALDFGIWKEVDPARLIVPLDTHIARISSNLGLTKRSTPGWKMAAEVTAALKRLDPHDPVKYDFALTRLGILAACPSRRDKEKCAACMIREVCVL